MFRKISKKQKETLKVMKKNRQIDSDSLRNIIEQKQKWAFTEKNKGLKNMEELKIQIERLNGILLFIQDLLQPKEEKKEERK